jgi:transcription elongation GreA/GreB family factor
MNAKQWPAWVGSGRHNAVADEWMQAIEDGRDLPAEPCRKALEAMVAAGQGDTAETLGWATLSEGVPADKPARACALARAVVSALPDNAELRTAAERIYRQAHGEHEHFDALMAEAGLTGNQSPRRAFRTLDTCLSIRPGDHLVNRFDNEVLELVSFDDTMKEFELTDPRGRSRRFDPKNLADEYDKIDERDYRVLSAVNSQRLEEMISSSPDEVLISMCLAAGGQTTSDRIKDELVDKYIASKDWSKWWSRARSAAKKTDLISIEGRSPVEITYHPHGRTLEEELAADARKARTPAARLEVLLTYARGLEAREEEPNDEFAAPLISVLSEDAHRLAPRHPEEALLAAIGLNALADRGLPVEETPPSADDILGLAKKPAEAVAAQAGNDELFPPALEALARREDAVDQLARLMTLVPAERLDAVADALTEAGAADRIDQAISAAWSEPADGVEILLWLWNEGDKAPPEAAGEKVELLFRLLKAMEDIAADMEADRKQVKETNQRIRAALSARSYGSYRQAMETMDEALADVARNRITRSAGLSRAKRDDMLSILREIHFKLFIEQRAEAWEDEDVVWTSRPALERRQAEHKELTEVTMLENARAIGTAAEHGDLSENSEWKFAMEEREMLQARAKKMQDELAKARVLEPGSVRTDHITVGSRARLVRDADGHQLTLTFLGPWESDVENFVYSYKTQLAQDLMGRKIGDSVEIKLDGHEGTYRVEALESGVPPADGSAE